MEQKTFEKAKELDTKINDLTTAVIGIDETIKQEPRMLILVGAFNDRKVAINLEFQDKRLADDIKDFIVRRIEKERDKLVDEFKKL